MKWNKIVAFASAAVLGFSGMAAGFTTSSGFTAKAVDDCNDDWLHAEGSRLYDQDGNEVWLTGANWFGLNCTENCPHGLYAADCDDFLESVAEHGINIIRMPISTELLVSWMNGDPDPVSSVQASYDPPTDQVGEDGTVTKAGTYGNINKDFVLSDGKTLKNSMEIFDVIMQKMKEHGLKVMVDVHSPTEHNSGHNYNLWYYLDGCESADTMAIGTNSGEQITWDMWKDSITWLAEKYSNDDTIIAYDLKNEPHGKRGYSGTTCPNTIAKWDDSTDLNNWRYSATECANSILDVNPNALIMIEGVEQYPKTEKGYTYDTADIWQASADVSPWYGAWWGGNLRGVKDYPVTPDSGTSQIVYSPHDYGPSVYAQTWFDKDFTEQTLLDDYWYDTWAYINAEEIAPLFVGEWGGYMDNGDNEKWMTLLRDYMINHHINHTFWCLNPNSGDTGGLLGYDFTTWDTDKYGLFESSLWQTLDSGKYISLDHERPLGDGSTSISVSEFYSSYANAEGSNLDGGTKGTDSGSTKPVVTTTTEAATTTTTAATTTTLATTTTKATTTTAATTTAKATTTVAATTTTKTATTTTLAATTTKSSATSDSTDTNIMYGDVDLDGEVSMTDLVVLNKIVSNSIQALDQQITNADCNQSGTIDAIDAGLLLKFNVHIIDSLPYVD